MADIRHFPMPMTINQDEIDRGRMRALAMYAGRSMDDHAGRLEALRWVNHWRGMNEAAKLLRSIGAAE